MQERTTALLTDTRMGIMFWTETAITVTVTNNRIPPFSGKKTPSELLYGAVPDVSDLRAIGCNG